MTPRVSDRDIRDTHAEEDRQQEGVAANPPGEDDRLTKSGRLHLRDVRKAIEASKRRGAPTINDH